MNYWPPVGFFAQAFLVILPFLFFPQQEKYAGIAIFYVLKRLAERGIPFLRGRRPLSPAYKGTNTPPLQVVDRYWQDPAIHRSCEKDAFNRAASLLPDIPFSPGAEKPKSVHPRRVDRLPQSRLPFCFFSAVRSRKTCSDSPPLRKGNSPPPPPFPLCPPFSDNRGEVQRRWLYTTRQHLISPFSFFCAYFFFRTEGAREFEEESLPFRYAAQRPAAPGPLLPPLL